MCCVCISCISSSLSLSHIEIEMIFLKQNFLFAISFIFILIQLYNQVVLKFMEGISFSCHVPFHDSNSFLSVFGQNMDRQTYNHNNGAAEPVVSRQCWVTSFTRATMAEQTHTHHYRTTIPVGYTNAFALFFVTYIAGLSMSQLSSLFAHDVNTIFQCSSHIRFIAFLIIENTHIHTIDEKQNHLYADPWLLRFALWPVFHVLGFVCSQPMR